MKNALTVGLVCLTIIALGGLRQFFSSSAAEREISRLNQEVAELRERLASLGSEHPNSPEAVSSSRSNAELPVHAFTFSLDDSSRNDPYLGSKDAPLILMGFLSYGCQTCRRFVRETLPELKAKYIHEEKLQFILRDFPLPSEAGATDLAAAAHCAGEQGKYWEAFDVLFAGDGSEDARVREVAAIAGVDEKRLRQCLQTGRYSKEIGRDIAEGKRLGVQGLPAFVVGKRLSDGTYAGALIRGAQPFKVFDEYLKSKLS
ncbi:MAG: thioredoxin domain-containing protein [Bdellovibrionales bacterium]|nr:thioredoxin domain-containing protein [Bdellovibrionales bacterium]